VQAVLTHQLQVLGMSALLTTTMPGMQDVIQELKKQGLRDMVKVIIGGGPVSRK
jgi:methanogenic corrinoid protein MtbC1